MALLFYGDAFVEGVAQFVGKLPACIVAMEAAAVLIIWAADSVRLVTRSG